MMQDLFRRILVQSRYVVRPMVVEATEIKGMDPLENTWGFSLNGFNTGPCVMVQIIVRSVEQ